MAEQLICREFTHAHLFGGIGGGAMGLNAATLRLGNLSAHFRCVGSIDVDPRACKAFEDNVGVPASCLDLFDEEQYRAWHGKAPPAGWVEATPADVRRAFGNEQISLALTSPPCKGFSGLLAESSSQTAKYQALNRLALRGIWLLLEAYPEGIPLVFFENVPRIMQRGRHFLDQIAALFRSYGYLFNETTHDCGEIGGLAQSRKRFLGVARHKNHVPAFLYEPPKRRLRGVGEVIGRLPPPGDIERGGAMHRIPALQWQTWVRLAFVESGKDWRSLNSLRVEGGVLKDFAIAPVERWHNGALGVTGWQDPSGVVTSNGRPAAGAFSVADPREEMWGSGQAGVTRWDEPSCTVRGVRSPLQNRGSVADPRIDAHPRSVQLGVRPWNRPAPAIKTDVSVGTGPYAVADPRMSGPRYNNIFRIVPIDSAAPAIAGPGGPAGGLCVADPRGSDNRHVNGKYKITAYDDPANAVIAASTTGNGACGVADPRIGKVRQDHHLGVLPFEEPAGAITGNAEPTTGRFAVADPRVEARRNSALGVLAFDQPTGVVAGESLPPNGAYAVADPRTGFGAESHCNKLKVVTYERAAPTVTGSDRVGSGALSVADPRPKMAVDRTDFRTQGHYGILPFDSPAKVVSASACLDNGFWSVADPRWDAVLPGLEDRLVCVIIARDGTWHRPFTGTELAAIQGLIDPDNPLGFKYEGKSESAFREHVGNCIPPAAATAIGQEALRTLLMAEVGETFRLSDTPIWVRQLAVALSVDTSEQVPS